MSSEETIVLSTVVLAVLLVIVLAIALRRRRKKCPRCGTPLPRGITRCPVCQGGVAAPPPSIRETNKPYSATPLLVAKLGPLAQKQFPISAQGLTIGRHPENDIVLSDELMVSRFHAVITLENGHYVLYDRDSANGTWVNEQRIFRHVLIPGDRIQIWQSQFVFATSDIPSPPPPPPSDIALRSTIHIEGEEFCNYHLESLIGRGGMSEVFRAHDANGRTVAIKILQQTDPYLVAKFAQEGNKIGPLLRGHANIVYVHEFGQSPDNRLYIVMEYIDAPSLRKSMHGPMGEAETIKIMGQVCSALSFAHQNNIVHRDIKPENILVTRDGVAKVLDFGIAKLTSASTVTRDKIVGTPEYISPEQARGEPVQPASDVYSIGIVLYEMLSGSVPFPRPRNADPYQAAIEVVRQHLKSEPESLRKRNPSIRVSSKLERVTMRALKKNLKDRYTTARELGEALGYQEIESPIESSRPVPIEQAPVGARLIILQGPRQGEQIPLSQTTTLGRFELGSTNMSISRRHANVFFRGGSYWLEDMSKNGTWVDSVRVYGEVPLRKGAMISIADNVLRLETG